MENPASDSQNPYASPTTSPAGVPASTSPNTPTAPLLQPIHISGSLSLEDYLYGFKLARRKLMRYIWVVCIVVFSILCIWEVNQVFFDVHEIGVIVVFVIFLITAIFALKALFWIFNRRNKKLVARGKGPFANTDIFISEEGYEARSELASGKVSWAIFSQFRSSDRMVVLYYDGNPNLYLFFPRSKFQTPEDWECFIGLLDRKMPRC